MVAMFFEVAKSLLEILLQIRPPLQYTEFLESCLTLAPPSMYNHDKPLQVTSNSCPVYTFQASCESMQPIKTYSCWPDCGGQSIKKVNMSLVNYYVSDSTE